MKTYSLSEMEEKFSYIIWKNEPISSKELAVITENEFSWKRTTMYTMLRRLIDKGLFYNENGSVGSIISENDYESSKTENIVNESFEGSLPKFITAFTRKNKLKKDDIKEILEIINRFEEE